MSRNGQCSLGEDTLERGRIVDQHIPRRCAHEYLDSACLTARDALDLLDIVVRGAEVKREIRVAATSRALALLAQ